MKRLLIGFTLIFAIVFLFHSCDLLTTFFGLNDPPIADAGPDQVVDLGDEVTLDGTGSSDPDGDQLTYSWTLNSWASGSALRNESISGASNAIAYVTPDKPGTYVFELTVADDYDSASDLVKITVVEQQPQQPPATPTGLAVGGATQSTLNVSWNASTNADNYSVFWDSSQTGSFDNIAYFGTDTSFTNVGLLSGTTYWYKVKASNDAGDSARSIAVSGTTLVATEPPATPEAPVISNPTEISLKVSWNAVSGAVQYYLYSDTADTGSFSNIVYSGGATTFIDSGLIPLTTYYYKVVAWNLSGYSAYSAIGSGTTTAEAAELPDQPTGLTVLSQTSSSITIGWSAAANAAAYKVFSDSSGAFAQIGTAGTLQYTQSGLAPQTSYHYYVIATNTQGDSDPSATVTGTTLVAAPATPSAPTVSGATNTTLNISWTAVTGASTYTLHRSTDSVSFVDLGLAVTGTSYTDTGLDSGKIYYYKVQAFNAGGASGLSSFGFSTTTTTVSAPTNVQVSGATVSSLTVTWYAVAGATEYRVFRDLSSLGTFTNQVYTGSETTFTNAGLSAGTKYFYKVKAVVGTAVSPFSTVVEGTTLVSVPSAPTGLTVGGATSTSLYISWNEVPTATSYTLAYENDVIVYTGPNKFFNDDGLASDTTYQYKVLASNAAGNGPFSGIVSGTTVGAPPVPPANVTANALNNSEIQVNWDSVAGADVYKIYRQREDGFRGFLTDVDYTTTFIIDRNLPSGTRFTYWVKAGNELGDSEYSMSAEAKTLGPRQPDYIDAYDANAYSVQVSWSWIEGAEGYKLYRTTDPGVGWDLPVIVYDTWVRDGGLMPNTEYFYKVTAFAGGEESSFSPTISVWTSDPPTYAPSMPWLWNEGVTSDSITLKWDYIYEAEYYRVYQSPGDGFGNPTGDWTQIYEGPNTKFMVEGLTPSTQYWFVATAVNPYGESSLDNWQTWWTNPLPAAVPGMPLIYVNYVGDTWVDMSWDGVSDAEYYILEVSQDGGLTWMEIYTGPQTWFYAQGLVPGFYQFRVAAANNLPSQGPWSEPPLIVEVTGSGGVIIIVE